MTLKQRNAEQIKLSLQLHNRLKYFLATGSIIPSRANLVLFFIKTKARQYSDEH